MTVLALAGLLDDLTPDEALAGAESSRQERDIIQRAQRLDQAALSWIYESYYPRVYSYLLLQLGEAQQAEDIASEVMLKVLEGLPKFRWRGAPFSAWIFRIARNCLIDHHRRRKRRNEVSLDLVDEAKSQDPTPQSRTEAADSYWKLRKALQQLSEDQRQVIILKFAQGLDNKAIAKVLGRREGAIKSLQHRALQNLRRILEREGEEG